MDKRRLSDEENRMSQPPEAPEENELDGETAGASEPAFTETEETRDAGGIEHETQGPPDVAGLLAYMLNLLGAAAWQWMGVIVSPETGQAVTDLAQARLAIDSFEAVSKQLTPLLDERTTREVQNALADLRVNFVERSTKAKTGGSA